MMFLADATYQRGWFYSDASTARLLLAGASTMMMMTMVLAAGLIMRDRCGIGFEKAPSPVIYIAAVILPIVRAAQFA